MSSRRLTHDEMKQQLIDALGWSEAHRRIQYEAACLRVSAESTAAIRSAYATYRIDYPNQTPQGELFP